MIAATPALELTAGTTCAHCDQPVPSSRTDGYCCRGCRVVATLLRSSSLERYYDLRRGPGVPVADLREEARETSFLDPIVERLATSDAATTIDLELQGLHCSACIWLVETLFARAGAPGSIEINPALGHARLTIDGGFPLRAFVTEVEAFGYRVGLPEGDAHAADSDRLLVRVGICLALAGNAMMLSAAIHLGLRSGATYTWVNHLSFAASTIAMLIGAPIFVRSAWAGVRRGLLHLDLPIALGMLLAFAGSVWSFARGGGANYTDTLTAFVALMLLGRWLQTRILERNRREMLHDPGLDGLVCRRVDEGRSRLVPCASIEAGDELIVAPGELVPVRARLDDEDATFSFDWIDGESAPRSVAAGSEVPSGALLAGDVAVRVHALESFRVSTVASLLREKRTVDPTQRTIAGLPSDVGAVYVVFVLVAAALSGGLAYLRTQDLIAALEITTAALVVTCPCAFGIAVPLAYELVQSRLRRSGVFVRDPSLFERALRIRRVIFDKTGTLTTGRLGIADGGSFVERTSREHLAALHHLASRSNHPKSRALSELLEARGLDARPADAGPVRESRGQGLEARIGGSSHRLGSIEFVVDDPDARSILVESGADLVHTIDGRPVLALRTTEAIRPETGAEVRRLEALGLEIHLLSGDRPERCAAVAAELGIPADRVVGSSRPESKEAYVLAHEPERSMMIGDGLNDARALRAAGCSGTPSIERPFTASRCDFYFVSPGLEPVRRILLASRSLAEVVRADLAIAFAYNVGAVALCTAGLMRPWLAAILMPASSLATLAFTTWFLDRGARRWTS